MLPRFADFLEREAGHVVIATAVIAVAIYSGNAWAERIAWLAAGSLFRSQGTQRHRKETTP